MQVFYFHTTYKELKRIIFYIITRSIIISTLPTRNWNTFKSSIKIKSYFYFHTTYKELKHRSACFVILLNPDFHTTYKELKLQKSNIELININISTLPTRNWNCKVALISLGAVANFHTTYKELKLLSPFLPAHDLVDFHTTYKELKPVGSAINPRFPRLFPHYLQGIETQNFAPKCRWRGQISTLPTRNWNKSILWYPITLPCPISTLPTRNWNMRQVVFIFQVLIISTLPTRNWNEPLPSGTLLGCKISTLPTRNWNIGAIFIAVNRAAISTLPTRNWNKFNTSQMSSIPSISTLPTRNWNIYFLNMLRHNQVKISTLPTRNWNRLTSSTSPSSILISTLPTRNWNTHLDMIDMFMLNISTLPTRNWNTAVLST